MVDGGGTGVAIGQPHVGGSGVKSEGLYVTTGGLFPDSFKQKAIAC